MDLSTPATRACTYCLSGNTSLEFQRFHIERPVETPGVAIVGSLWKCRTCQRAAFIPDRTATPKAALAPSAARVAGA